MALMSGYIRNQRLNAVKPYIKGDVLDIACGQANVLLHFGEKINNYTGIEFSETRVKELKSKYPTAEFFAKDLDEDDLMLSNKFDVILMIALIEHIYNQKHLFAQILKNLKPSGKIVITTPTPFGNDIIHRYGANLGLFSKAAADDHIVIYNKKRFQILAKDFRLSIDAYKRFQLGCNQLVVLGHQNL